MSETIVEKTAEEWREENVVSILHILIDNATMRSEAEASSLHELVSNLDSDPAEIIAAIEAGQIKTAAGGGGVDPILAKVIADNAALRNDVQALLAALQNANAPVETPVAADAGTTVQNADGTSPVTFADGSTVTKDASGNVVSSTPAESNAATVIPAVS